jgi:hypothetical protein
MPATMGQRIVAWLVGGDQLGLFVLAGIGVILLTPRVLLMGYYDVFSIFDPKLASPDVTVWPYVPRRLPVGVALALLTFRLERRFRLAALVLFAVPFAWILGILPAQVMVPLTVFVLVAYAIIRLPLPRLFAGILMTMFAVAALVAAVQWWPGSRLVGFLGSFPALVPVLWYSVYEHARRTALSLRRFLLYILGRVYASPIMTYDELFASVSGPELTATRWAGMRAVYIALAASFVAHLATRLSATVPRATMTGLPLLGLSYIEYVGYYCLIVQRFNTVIGVLRLFGVPVRSNFRYWLLARTPNEHWQRWNILAREWFLTFIFYPIMRARRWLFAAVMAALLTAGVLHTVPVLIINGFHAPFVFASMVYWIANALAIYAVIQVPKRYPALIDRLGMRSSLAWSAVGVVLTSGFYAVLHGMRSWSGSWADLTGFLMRLVGVDSP